MKIVNPRKCRQSDVFDVLTCCFYLCLKRSNKWSCPVSLIDDFVFHSARGLDGSKEKRNSKERVTSNAKQCKNK